MRALMLLVLVVGCDAPWNAKQSAPRPPTPEDTVVAFRTARQREFNRPDPFATAVNRSAVGLSAAADALAAAGEVGTATARELTFARSRLARQLDEEAALRREVDAQRKALSYVTASHRELEHALDDAQDELDLSKEVQRDLVQQADQARRNFGVERWETFREIVLSDVCPKRAKDCRDRAMAAMQTAKPAYDACLASTQTPQIMDARDLNNRSSEFADATPITDFHKLSTNKLMWCPLGLGRGTAPQ